MWPTQEGLGLGFVGAGCSEDAREEKIHISHRGGGFVPCFVTGSSGGEITWMLTSLKRVRVPHPPHPPRFIIPPIKQIFWFRT